MAHYSWDGKTQDLYWAGPTATFQEPSFIFRAGGGEGEGYIIALLNHLDVLRNDIVIFDAQCLNAGPIAIIHLPLKLKLGLHGNFVEQAEIEEWASRRAGDLGPVDIARRPLLWQEKLTQCSEPKASNEFSASVRLS
jgi:hypothetical protein